MRRSFQASQGGGGSTLITVSEETPTEFWRKKAPQMHWQGTGSSQSSIGVNGQLWINSLGGQYCPKCDVAITLDKVRQKTGFGAVPILQYISDSHQLRIFFHQPVLQEQCLTRFRSKPEVQIRFGQLDSDTLTQLIKLTIELTAKVGDLLRNSSTICPGLDRHTLRVDT